jgi:hypothetical protein
MLNTLELISNLPQYECSKEATQMSEEEWMGMLRKVHAAAFEDMLQLVKEVRQLCPLSLLAHTQHDHVAFGKPYQGLGFIRILGDDEYLLKTQGEDLATGKDTRGHMGSYTLHGMEIRFNMFRPMHLPERMPPLDVIFYGLSTELEIHSQPDFVAFREIYKDWRGILRKMLSEGPFEFFMNESPPEVDRVKSKDPLKKLEAVFTMAPDSEKAYFHIGFNWRDVERAQGLRAFLQLAVLFTCIQKAAIAPRSKREHLLQYWLALNGAAQ